MMATQNSYPKPFVKNSMYNDSGVPRIMVNNRQQVEFSLPYQHHQQLHQDNPTSTVHKSLAHSRQYGSQSHASASYSRLISPTVSQQGSLSPQSSVEFVQQRSQQHQHHDNNNQNQQHNMINEMNNQGQYNQHQHAPSSGFGGSPRFASTTTGSHMQHQYKLPVLQQQSASSPKANATLDSARIETDNQDYRQLLARISPSSPRQQASGSNVLLPDDKRDGYMHDKQIEQLSIAHQTYRTTPIVLPKPKARHDLATGSYMHLNQDPTWDMLERVNQQQLQQSKLDHSAKLNQSINIYPNDVVRSLPTSSLHNINSVSSQLITNELFVR